MNNEEENIKKLVSALADLLIVWMIDDTERKENHTKGYPKMALLKHEDLGPKTQDRIKKLLKELSFDFNRVLFWESLNEKDKNKLTNAIEKKNYYPKNKSLPNAYIPEIWEILHNESEIIGTIKAAFQLEIISRSDRDELLQKIGWGASPIQVQKKSSGEKKPFWNQREGKIYFNGKAVLITQRRKKLSNIQIILQELQDQNWPDEIKNPLITTNCLIKDGIKYLNGISKVIQFSIAAGGNYLCWSVQKSANK